MELIVYSSSFCTWDHRISIGFRYKRYHFSQNKKLLLNFIKGKNGKFTLSSGQWTHWIYIHWLTYSFQRKVHVFESRKKNCLNEKISLREEELLSLNVTFIPKCSSIMSKTIYWTSFDTQRWKVFQLKSKWVYLMRWQMSQSR